jgi:hypothetical protein
MGPKHAEETSFGQRNKPLRPQCHPNPNAVRNALWSIAAAPVADCSLRRPPRVEAVPGPALLRSYWLMQRPAVYGAHAVGVMRKGQPDPGSWTRVRVHARPPIVLPYTVPAVAVAPVAVNGLLFGPDSFTVVGVVRIEDRVVRVVVKTLECMAACPGAGCPRGG